MNLTTRKVSGGHAWCVAQCVRRRAARCRAERRLLWRGEGEDGLGWDELVWGTEGFRLGLMMVGSE